VTFALQLGVVVGGAGRPWRAGDKVNTGLGGERGGGGLEWGGPTRREGGRRGLLGGEGREVVGVVVDGGGGVAVGGVRARLTVKGSREREYTYGLKRLSCAE